MGKIIPYFFVTNGKMECELLQVIQCIPGSCTKSRRFTTARMQEVRPTDGVVESHREQQSGAITEAKLEPAL
jgi:hypothetical protein